MKFVATFQQKYLHEEHPIIPNVTHLSFLIVEANNEMKARHALADALQGDYAFIYEFDNDFMLRQVPEYRLEPLPVAIRYDPTSSCGSSDDLGFVWAEPTAESNLETIGCICHTNIKEFLTSRIESS